MNVLYTLSSTLVIAAIVVPVVFVLMLLVKSHVTRAVFLRNTMSYFLSVIGYLFIVAFCFVAAQLAFDPTFFANNLASLDQLSAQFPQLLLFIVPAITMTAWSEERKLGTDELLFTIPSTDREILIGKYLAVVAVYTVVLGFSKMIWVMLAWIGSPSVGLFFTTYLGYWLAGLAMLAAGLFASSLTRSTPVAFLLGAAVCAIPVYLPEIYTSLLAVWDWNRFIPGISGDLEYHLSSNYLFPDPNLAESLSVGEQLRDFSLGMIPLSSVLYFISFATIMLYLNYIVIRKRLWSRGQSMGMGLQYAVRAVAVTVAIISLNIIGYQAAVRADLTPQKYYTLSQGTENVIENIEAERPVIVQAFLSPEVPGDYLPAKKQLVGLLRQIDKEGGSKIDVQFIDVEPFSEEVEQAERFGITPRNVQTMKDGRISESDVYLGLVFESSYDTVILPFVGDGATPLEYEITRSLATVSNATRLTVGIVDSQLQLMGANAPGGRSAPPWRIIEELRQQYNVEAVDTTQEIDNRKKLFTLEVEAAKSLDKKELNETIRQEFDKNDILFSDSPTITVTKAGEQWVILDEATNREYTIEKDVEEVESEEENAAEDEESDDKPEDTKPEPVLNVYGKRYDVIIAVMPSMLEQTELNHLTEWVQNGGPTLIFDDPVPAMFVQPRAIFQMESGPDGERLAMRQRAVIQMSPNIPPPPPQQGQPPTQYGRIEPMLDLLGISWKSGELVWDQHNPLRNLEAVLPTEFIFADARAHKYSLNSENEITKGLEQVFLAYSGTVVPLEGRTDVEVDYLIATSGQSGVLKWDDYTMKVASPSQRGPMTVLRNPRDPILSRGLPSVNYVLDDGHWHGLAVRVKGKAKDDDTKKVGSKINAIFVADTDIIGDWLFQLRRENSEYQFDNVTFVLNAVDELAGVEELIPIRRRKPKQPTLTRIEKEVAKLRKAEQDAEAKAQKDREKTIDRIEKQFEEQRESIKNNADLSQLEQEDELARIEAFANREVQVASAQADQEMQAKQRRITAYYQRRIRETENIFRAYAIAMSVVPPILVGMIFLGLRVIGERQDIPSGRRL
ncbi:Gldg family protein [Thalassoroseus pseudoceratinae]|uniref:Gldg family protein n=1 Tax=Thalassoroseus pseudoceratinae TaxID=2713176 RepID=UPI00141F8472|nr:Gldg family protein [Thalassoroseus pseudoceratinae]